MIPKRKKGDLRSDSEIREHYEIEIELANKLKNSTREERKFHSLYTTLYDELFSRVPHHTQIVRKQTPEISEKAIRIQLGLLNKFISPDSCFMEIGPGDCALSFAVSKRVKKVVAIDVSNIITEQSIPTPSNFKLIISDGSNIPLPDNETDIVYSNQLMEHIHPDDATIQLKEIYRTLKPKGYYVCCTPNAVNGPWDISYSYNEVAEGFHLKEYSVHELSKMFREIGFRKSRTYVGAKGVYIPFPRVGIILLENFLLSLPFEIRSKLGRSVFFRTILGIKIVAFK